MYRRHFGIDPGGSHRRAEPLDVAVAWTADRKALTISIINPTYETQRLAFSVVGADLAVQGKAWVLTAADDMAYNDPGKPPVVAFTEQKVSGLRDAIEVAPASAMIVEIPIRPRSR